MASVIVRPAGWIPERHVTPESVFWNRRRVVKSLGLAGLSGLVAGVGVGRVGGAPAPSAAGPYAKGYPHARAAGFDPGWSLTDEAVASKYNNFYEFTLSKDVYKRVAKFETAPWKLEVGGLVESPLTLDAAELIDGMALEERVYRFRCVEAWAMIVPWTGFPLAKLVERVKPKPEARFVRFVTAAKRDEMPGIAENPEYPWPYFEGLRLDEALHPLTMVVTGVYGKPLPRQFGAPIRVVVPWKYGYKSPKSIVKIEFVANQPKTFWETLIPREYPFESNVDPGVPHPRWSQATERMIDTGDRVKTKKYNGYAEQVARLYPSA
ncbi:MAG: protein-methionine-sulfoxide reductase catalytic subunit MsrP [Verrucomicrobiales bacterium]|nr:protein-methionine-sulfoxide reductase catalytic subunit MsrP [Verrucomicrobiales bacterium]